MRFAFFKIALDVLIPCLVRPTRCRLCLFGIVLVIVVVIYELANSSKFSYRLDTNLPLIDSVLLPRRIKCSTVPDWFAANVSSPQMAIRSKTKVAFLIIERNMTSKEINRLNDQLCRFVANRNDSFSSTMFIFSPWPDSFKHLKCDASLVTLVSIPEISVLEQGVDRCQIYLQNSDNHDYFNPSSFDFIFSIDPSVQITDQVNVERLLYYDFTAFSHPSLIMKYGRWSKGAEIYSSKIFGGRVENVKYLCQNISNQARQSVFQLQFNNYLKTNPPTKTIFTGAEGDCDKMAMIYKASFTKIINITYENEHDYWMYLEVISELETANGRQQKAKQIASELRQHYLRKIAQQIASQNVSQFVTASCRFNRTTCYDDWFVSPVPKSLLEIEDQLVKQLRIRYRICRYSGHGCFGLGDRLRGTVTAFYLAVATGRIFHIDWPSPANIADYFLINEHFYKQPAAGYEELWDKAANKTRPILHRGDIPDSFLFAELMKKNFVEQHQGFGNIILMSNRYAGLEGVTRNKNFYDNLHESIPTAFDEETNLVQDYLPVISAGLRTIFAQPTAKFQRLLDDIIDNTVGRDFWSVSAKIGVQIRTELIEVKVGTRVKLDQIRCFVEEIKRIISLKIRNPFLKGSRYKPVTVFVTSDWNVTEAGVAEELSKLSGVRVFNTNETFNLTVTHMDHVKPTGTDDEIWQKSAKGFLDWYLLTKMDFLVISRSGFSESASLLSLSPTRRFRHDRTDFRKRCSFDDYYEELSTLHTSFKTDIYDVL